MTNKGANGAEGEEELGIPQHPTAEAEAAMSEIRSQMEQDDREASIREGLELEKGVSAPPVASSSAAAGSEDARKPSGEPRGISLDARAGGGMRARENVTDVGAMQTSSGAMP